MNDLVRNIAPRDRLSSLPLSVRPGYWQGAPQQGRGPRPLNADQALAELLAGNQRFAIGKTVTPRRSPEDFRALAHGQFPEAVIVSCADSRVAPEILFDVGVGDIFVVRVAGNVIDGAGVSVKGSIEYGVAELNAPLILVLGHSGCGAVKAAIQHINDKDSLPGAINGLVELVKPAVSRSKGMPATRWKTLSAKTSRSASKGSRDSSLSWHPASKKGRSRWSVAFTISAQVRSR